MRPIERLLKYTEDKYAYFLLSDNFDSIVPYIGTGLSFYFRGWWEPFQAIISDIKGTKKLDSFDFQSPLSDEDKSQALEMLQKYGNNVDDSPESLLQCLEIAIKAMDDAQSDTEKKIGSIIPADTKSEDIKSQIWETINRLYKSDRYLEVGELLDLISYVVFKKHFNIWFFEKIDMRRKDVAQKITQEEKKINNLTSLANIDILPESNWFLPYFGKNCHFIITTNTDDTLDEVYRRILGTTNKLLSGKDVKTKVYDERKRCLKTGNEAEKIVYHIHGYQPSKHEDTTDTFIMTWSDYWHAYKKGNNKSSMRVLEECFSHDSFVFLGASLAQDETVAIMKEETKKEHTINKHVAFFQTERISNTEASNLRTEMATHVLTTPDFIDYSTILCQIVRENKNHEWSVYRQIINNTYEPDPTWQKKIEEFLYPPNHMPYARLKEEVLEEDLEKHVFPVIKSKIFSKGSRTYEWAVCRVDNDDFEFPIKCKSKSHSSSSTDKNSDISVCLDSYSAPLGNTIYILGGKKTTPDKMANIENAICTWTNNHEKGYWDVESGESVKIRIIRISDLTPEIVIDRLDVLIKTDLDDSQRFEMLHTLICEMKEYKTYSTFETILDNIIEQTESPEDMISVLLTFLSVCSLFKAVTDEINRIRNGLEERKKESKDKQYIKKRSIELNEEIGEKK